MHMKITHFKTNRKFIMFNKMKSIKVLQMVESPLNSFSKIEEILIKQMIPHIQKE
jgi:hypothetical protein